ncbi:hypothetical protein RUND412_007380 [Rhizina undulata]
MRPAVPVMSDFELTSPTIHELLNMPSSSAAEDVRQFACPICPKAFEKRASRDRHTRRCRQKRLEDSVPRKKACSQCTQSKTRCDLKLPHCSRCRAKSLQCFYANKPRNHSQPEPQNSPQNQPHTHFQLEHNGTLARLATALPAPPDLYAGFEGDSVVSMTLDDNGMILGDDLDLNLDVGEFGWIPEAHLDPTQAHASSQSEKSIGGHLPGYQQISSDEALSTQLIAFRGFHQIKTRFNSMIEPSNTTTLKVSRSLSSYTVDFMERILRTYPTMMLRHETLPPFIHKSHVAPGKISEHLSNCMGLAHLYKAKTRENSKLVFQAILHEHNRLMQEWSSYDESEMLAALQAMFVYSLMRHFDEDAPENARIDVGALMALEQVALSVGWAGIIGKNNDGGIRPDWEVWVNMESKKRMMMGLYMFDSVYLFRKGLPILDCDELGNMALPAIKLLWEAPDEKTWGEEYSGFVRETEGKSFRMHELWNSTPESRELDPWYAGMDSFGVLIMGSCMRYRQYSRSFPTSAMPKPTT